MGHRTRWQCTLCRQSHESFRQQRSSTTGAPNVFVEPHLVVLKHELPFAHLAHELQELGVSHFGVGGLGQHLGKRSGGGLGEVAGMAIKILPKRPTPAYDYVARRGQCQLSR